jgi:hypothetical protein
MVNKKQVNLKKHLKDNFEMLDAAGLAKKFSLPESWIRNHTRKDSPDPIPCVRAGKYVRFEWPSEPLNQWWARHRQGTSELTPAPTPLPPTASQPRRIVRPALLKRKAGL